VNNLTDQQLLAEYARCKSEPAFAELVQRHLDFVYSAALRLVHTAPQAEDVAQAVFLALAKDADKLTSHPVLSGWLHRTTQNLAANSIRTDVRRRIREQEAAAMNQSDSSGPDWEPIADHLDAALNELNENDREALLLRFFERKSSREIAGILGTSEEAAQKRINRAIERLRQIFAKRGVTVGVTGLTVALTTSAVQSAPAGLALTISALASTTTLTAVTTTTATAAVKTIAMTAIQKTLLAIVLTASIGVGIYQTHQTSVFKEKIKEQEQQHASLQQQIEESQKEYTSLSNILLKAESHSKESDLSRLGSLAGKRPATHELATLKANARQSLDNFTNMLAPTMVELTKMKSKEALAKLARMKTKLQLTEEQEQSIKTILLNSVTNQFNFTMDILAGKTNAEKVAQITKDEEEAIKRILDSKQLSDYPKFVQNETDLSNREIADFESDQLGKNFSLSKQQQNQISDAFLEINKAPFSAPSSSNPWESAKHSQKERLEKKIAVLQNYLTPEQISTYREEQSTMIETMTKSMKALMPSITNKNSR